MTLYGKIKRSSIERFPCMLKTLKVNIGYSPNMIAKKIKCDKRTVEKMLKVGEELKIVRCEKMILGDRTYRACKLSPKFKKLFEIK